MDISLQTRASSRGRAVLAGLAVLGGCLFASLTLADVSSAAVPPSGINCQANDGKISGRGSTYQTVLQATFDEAYSNDFCGNVVEQYSGDPAGKFMSTYNYAAAEAASATGSGAGIKAASCRTDAFTGTDTPYTEAQATELNEAPGKLGGSACKLTFDPPFTPQGEKPGSTYEYPNSTDVTAPIMSFPIGGSSVAIIINFGTACTVKDPTTIKLTGKEVSRLYGGDVATWADSEIDATNPVLSSDGCTGAVTRVVRQDSSGTTNILKQYLIRDDNARPEQKCGVISGAIQNWEAYFSTNTEWPGFTTKHAASEEGTCSTLTKPEKSGNPEVIAKVKSINGAVGYADLPQAQKEGASLVEATVQNSTATGYQSPVAGKGANCTYAGVVNPPGNGGAGEAVGIGNTEGKNWANNAEPSEENVTDRGSKYPICGLTFDLVYSGLSGEKSPNAITPLTADQRRTLYSYFTFVLSSTAQNLLTNIDYAPVPAAWLQELREGFQENF